MLQRAAWSYFGGRTRFGGGDLDWDQQGSFQGHVVVLIDEHTSSDGEGVSRSISELGLGRLIGTRTWGGGIWLASDNTLVDGGIATAPEFGVYNDKFGWGMGIGKLFNSNVCTLCPLALVSELSSLFIVAQNNKE